MRLLIGFYFGFSPVTARHQDPIHLSTGSCVTQNQTVTTNTDHHPLYQTLSLPLPFRVCFNPFDRVTTILSDGTLPPPHPPLFAPPTLLSVSATCVYFGLCLRWCLTVYSLLLCVFVCITRRTRACVLCVVLTSLLGLWGVCVVLGLLLTSSKPKAAPVPAMSSMRWSQGHASGDRCLGQFGTGPTRLHVNQYENEDDLIAVLAGSFQV